MKHKEACGCVHDGRRWLSMCATDKAQADEIHNRAKADHDAKRNREREERARRDKLEELGFA